MDSSVQRQPTVPCPGLSAVSSPTSAVGSDTVYSSQEMGTFYPVDTTHRDNLDEIVIEMEGRQVSNDDKFVMMIIRQQRSSHNKKYPCKII